MTTTLASKTRSRFAPSRLRASLRTHLVTMILLATVPLAVLTSIQMLGALKQQHAALSAGLQSAAAAAARGVDQELAASIDALETLARTDALERGDTDGFRDAVAAQPPPRPTWSGILLLDPDGAVLLDTSGRAWRSAGASVAHEGFDPPAMARLLSANRALLSDLIDPADPTRRTTALVVPASVGGNRRYALGAYIGVDAWRQVLQDAAPPDKAAFASLFDTRHRIVARTLAPERFVGANLPASAVQAMGGRASGVHRTETLEGGEAYAAWHALGHGGWGVGVGTVASPLDRLQDRAVGMTLATTIACLLIGVTAALLVARRVTDPLDHLAAHGAFDGAPIAVTEIALLRDALARAATQRQLALDRLARKAEEFEALFRSSPLGLVFAQDARCALVIQNRAMDEIAPLSLWTQLDGGPAGAAGRPELLHQGEPLEPRLRPLQRAAAGGESVEPTELEVRVPGQPVHFVLASAEPLRTATGLARGAIGAVIDITERKRAEADAETASRAKDEFLAMLGHELRNPLNAIATAVEVLNRVEAAAPAAIRAREIIANQTRHLARMMDRLLDVGRVIGDDVELLRQPVELAALVGRALNAAHSKAMARQHRFEVSLSETWVDADVQRIEQVLEQLLDNAIRYTPPGGSISVRLHADDGMARLTVRDSGVGIDPALMQHVFQPFVQGERGLARHDGGLGIGLTLVKRLLELHGGSITARSDASGSVFDVQLPLLRHGAGASAPTAAVKNVIVIDDNPDALYGLRSMLELDGHTVRTAGDGATGLAMLTQAPPEAAIVDIGLPGIDGYEVARQSRAAGYDGLLIALSGYGQERDIRHSCDAGFDAYLVKPVDATALMRLLVPRRAA